MNCTEAFTETTALNAEKATAQRIFSSQKEYLIANAAEVESIVNRIISVWEKVEARTADSAAEENAEESFADAADANAERLPLPLAGGLAQAPEADYETMSAEQFRTLRKQLKRAAMDGRRIRL